MMKFAVLHLGALLLSSSAICCVEGRKPTFTLSPRANPIESSLRKEPEHDVKTSNNKKVLLGLRGGAGPLDAEGFLKVFSSAGLLQGAVMTAGPKVSNDLYGIDSDSFLDEFVTKQCGTGIAAFSLTLYLMLFKNASLKDAMVPNVLIWTFTNLQSLLSGDLVEAGFKTPGFVFCLGACALMAYLLSTEHAEMALKVWSILWLPAGLQMILSPEGAAKAWGHTGTMSRSNNMMLRLFGSYLLSMSGMIGGQVFYDMEPLKAMGVGNLFFGAWHALGLLNGDCEAIGCNMFGMNVWLLVHIAGVVTTLF
mmetsp:Transcript_26045/g.57157  ORF Transcript_26045/g.57157 Transcript_26045/m.57157 type:complete len:308 (+) Transcript_26045:62-985(+)